MRTTLKILLGAALLAATMVTGDPASADWKEKMEESQAAHDRMMDKYDQDRQRQRQEAENEALRSRMQMLEWKAECAKYWFWQTKPPYCYWPGM
jgi:hypothetical protein